MDDHFDLEAITWDLDPERVKRAKIIGDKIKVAIPDTLGKDAMEVGCGTGLLSFCLQDHFSQIALVDTSKGMIEVLNEKIDKQKVNHFKTFHLNIFDLPESLPRVDVVYSLLTLHHIRDYKQGLKVSRDLLRSDGYVVIADLEKEDGSFHAHLPDYDLHNGFERQLICETLEELEMEVVHNSICYVIDSDKSGEMMSFPLFLIIGKKR